VVWSGGLTDCPTCGTHRPISQKWEILQLSSPAFPKSQEKQMATQVQSPGPSVSVSLLDTTARGP
jgi:hypothetical protein